MPLHSSGKGEKKREKGIIQKREKRKPVDSTLEKYNDQIDILTDIIRYLELDLQDGGDEERIRKMISDENENLSKLIKKMNEYLDNKWDMEWY